jgi:hypothetical protein
MRSTTGSSALMASSSGRVRRNSSEKMSSWISLHESLWRSAWMRRSCFL